MDDTPTKVRGRGAAENPADRFSRLDVVLDDATPGRTTQFFRDTSRSLLTENDSPDLPFQFSANPYRGCEHGCVYCYARPTHEYLGLSAGLDFESKILVKEDAPELLRRELMQPKWQPQVIALSGVTDCYQPVERKLGLTRRCLEVLAEFKNPTGIITKNVLVTRDADLLGELARHGAAMVLVSVTTLDDELAAALEPRASRPQLRLAAIAELARTGIPTGVLVAPVIPGLTDHEIPAIVAAAKEAGAQSASWQLLRLPFGVKELFQGWLERHRPDRRDKVLNRIRDLRDGKLNDARFGVRMRGEGEWAHAIEQLFTSAVARAGLGRRRFDLNAGAFRRPGLRQRTLFGAGR